MFLVDSHCHFDLLDLTPEDIQQVIARARASGVQYFLNVCVNIAGFPSLLKTSEQHAFIKTSVGLHPNDQTEEVTTETLIQLGQQANVIAMGETGLDYFRTTGDVHWQQERFRAHIHAAQQLRKPLIVHTRQAKHDTLEIMQSEGAASVQGVMHCFTEDWEMAKKALDMGFYISFSGIVTFKSARTLQEVAKQVPLDRLLVETDAPYLTPNPHRGEPNEPAYVRHTAEYLANLRGISLEVLAEQTTNNFFTLFKGAARPHV